MYECIYYHPTCARWWRSRGQPAHGAAMSELSEKSFGLLIAYVLPGFATLWGISHLSPTIASWMNDTPQGAPTVAGCLYVTLASLTMGLTVSCLRWILIDRLHHVTGLKPPQWEFAHLDDRLEGFLALVENHYRYYQFYANAFIAGAITFAARYAPHGVNLCQPNWPALGWVLLGLVLLAGSRDSLRKYYQRVERLLGTREASERSAYHDQRFSPRAEEGQTQETPAAGGLGEEAGPGQAR